MSVDERARHAMYLAFEEAVGEPAAATLMTMLPPAGADLATSKDLDLFRAEMRAEMAELRVELANGFRSQTHTTVHAMIGLVATTAATVFGALHLTG